MNLDNTTASRPSVSARFAAMRDSDELELLWDSLIQLRNWIDGFKMGRSANPETVDVPHSEVLTELIELFADAMTEAHRSGWQPIGTAPKDCSAFLVTDGQDYALLKWDMTPGCLASWNFVTAGELAWHSGYDGKEEPTMQPTHWMPLPAQPER